MAGEAGMHEAGAAGDALVEAIARLARSTADGREIADVLHDVTELVTTALGLAGAGVVLVHQGRVSFATSDAAVLAELERVQEAFQEGPCADAAVTGETVAVDDLQASGDRWPRYVEHARSLGIAAVAGVPMRHAGDTIGAINLYDRAPRAWTADELRHATVFADIATGFVTSASEIEQQRRVTEQLQRALDSRVVIEQAKGIIAAHRGTSVDEAFRVLRRHANDHNADLRSTAHAVVHLGLRPD